MKLAEHIVSKLLKNQDYDHEPLDKVVQKLAKAGFPGATHREFDKYAGIYLDIPGIDRFWIVEWFPDGSMDLEPAHPKTPVEDEEESPKIIVNKVPGSTEIDELVTYIQQFYGSEIAHRKAQASAEKFMKKRMWR